LVQKHPLKAGKVATKKGNR